MKVFLAGVAPWRGGNDRLYDETIKKCRPFYLESFYYIDADTERLLPFYGDFLLDSGAFTFCAAGGFSESTFEEYLERYADFINRHHVEKFFELDVDSIVGYKKVQQYRRRLEQLTGRQPIPVWHKGRGKDEFIRHCEEYPYVALGGYAAGAKISNKTQQSYVSAFPWFISEAHKHGAKIHGLGYTVMEGLKKYHFDSVDSSAWTTGNRFGYIYKFTGSTMGKIGVPAGKKLKDTKQIALINFNEWVKFQRYAETHL